MRGLLIVMAVVEGGTGLALLAMPSLPMSLLLAGTLDSPATTTLARVTGAALLALGIACWMASREERSRAAEGVVTAMMVYSLAVDALFIRAGLGPPPHGIALWPAALAHALLVVWCLGCLRTARLARLETPSR